MEGRSKQLREKGYGYIDRYYFKKKKVREIYVVKSSHQHRTLYDPICNW